LSYYAIIESMVALFGDRTDYTMNLETPLWPWKPLSLELIKLFSTVGCEAYVNLLRLCLPNSMDKADFVARPIFQQDSNRKHTDSFKQ